jgi:hypothetical protein
VSSSAVINNPQPVRSDRGISSGTIPSSPNAKDDSPISARPVAQEKDCRRRQSFTALVQLSRIARGDVDLAPLPSRRCLHDSGAVGLQMPTQSPQRSKRHRTRRLSNARETFVRDDPSSVLAMLRPRPASALADCLITAERLQSLVIPVDSIEQFGKRYIAQLVYSHRAHPEGSGDNAGKFARRLFHSHFTEITVRRKGP